VAARLTTILVRFANDAVESTSSSTDSLDEPTHQITTHGTPGSASAPIITPSSTDASQQSPATTCSLRIFDDIADYPKSRHVVATGCNSPLRWHISSFEEAGLFRYFVSDLARWFDETDTMKHFSIAIPELAQGCASLTNAIMAFSAKQLSLQGKLPEAVSLHYTDACYKLLLPRLQEKAFVAAGLASVLLLRMVQHMTGKYRLSKARVPYTNEGKDSVSTDLRVGHDFLGLDVFLNALRANLDSSVHAAIFVNMLRFYTHLALTGEQPLALLDSNCEWLCHELPMPTDSRRWEWCALMECCRAVNFVFDDKPKTMERWLELESQTNDWRTSKASYLDPIYSEEDTEGDAFPRTVFASETHGNVQITFMLRAR